MVKKLNQLARNTDAKRKGKSKVIKVQLDRVGKKKPKRWDHWNVWFMFTVNSQERPGVTYDVIIQTIEDIGITTENWNQIATGNIPMMVSCTCPDFKYRWEVANQKQGNSMLLKSNGKLPVITNPKMKQWVCKHTLACYDRLKIIIRNSKLENIDDIRTKNYYNDK